MRVPFVAVERDGTWAARARIETAAREWDFHTQTTLYNMKALERR
jgi:hypothetical protein